MSKVYILEPPTKGKVLIKSTVGDIDIELWSKECPLACRNFIQHCLDNYYDNTIFHRVVSGFIVQGGDPTGTGEGGKPAFGEPFKDEFHSRLRFNRRGLVGVAKSNDLNGSQFFFTLDEGSELDKKHTLFGKVVGNTIFNMLRLADGEIENEIPVYPHKITSTEVLFNPFSDMVPRKSIEPVHVETQISKTQIHSRAIKDFGLLSFGDEAEEDEEMLNIMKKKIEIKAKTAHDINDPQLLSEPLPIIPFSVILPEGKESEFLQETADDRIAKRKAEEAEAQRQILQKEITELRKELKTSLENEAKKKAKEASDGSFVTQFNRDALRFSRDKEHINANKGKGKDREKQTMQLLDRFKRKMETVSNDTEDNTANMDDCKVQTEDANQSIKILFNHELESTETSQIRAIDANRDDDPERYDIHDPRNAMNKRRRETDQNVQMNIHRTRHML